LTWVKDLYDDKGHDATMKKELFTIQDMRTRLLQVEKELADTLQRMPAHGVKPGFMASLLELEDERDRLLDEIKALSSGAP
jgi:hypothetical protein